MELLEAQELQLKMDSAASKSLNLYIRRVYCRLEVFSQTHSYYGFLEFVCIGRDSMFV